MKVFVTGHKGYIGVHLVDLLKVAGHEVTGCDLGIFDGCEFEDFVRPDHELTMDVRNLTAADLDGHDCVMHLAAISNDPMGELDASLTTEINRDGSIRLAKVAREAGVGRFLLSGSCSVYGAGKKLDLSEGDPLAPLSAYAASKIDSEREILAMAADGFTPVSLRNSTAFGHSPMLRIDLVANNLLASALSYGEIRIMSDGSPWRPLIHCRDIARAFCAFLEAPEDTVKGVAVNVGGNEANYQVKDVADGVKRLMPDADITFTGEVGADPRNYRVRFDLLNSLLPDFALEYTLESGLEELHRKLRDAGFGKAEFESDRFVRLRTLRNRMNLLRPA